MALSKLNVVFICHGLYPCDTGGMEIFNYYLVRGLEDRVCILTLTSCRKFDSGEVYHTRDRVFGIRRYGIGKFAVILQEILLLIRLTIRKRAIHLIVVSYTSSSGYLGYYIPWISKILKIPYLVIIHGGGLYSWRCIRLHRSLFNNAAEIVAVSDRIREEYERRTGRTIRFIPPLIPFQASRDEKSELLSRYNLGEDAFWVISVGSLKKIKGCDILLSAFCDLGADFVKSHNLKLVFAGDGPLRPELERQARQSEVGDRVFFLGNIDRDRINGIYRLADIYVIGSFFEGTPISLLEALFNATPVIGADVSGINNIITDNVNGLLFEKSNVRDLREKIVRLVEDKCLRNELGASGKAYFEREYDHRKVVAAYERLFEEICLP